MMNGIVLIFFVFTLINVQLVYGGIFNFSTSGEFSCKKKKQKDEGERIFLTFSEIFADNGTSADHIELENVTTIEYHNITFTEADLLQAVNLAKFSYDRLKT